MSTVQFERPPRRHGPQMPRGELVLESPPELGQQLGRSYARLLMMLPMLAGAGAMAMLYSSNGNRGPAGLLIGGMFGISMLGMMAFSFGGMGGGRGAEQDAERRDYMRYLAQVRRQARRAANQQRASLIWTHPAPDALWSIAASSRLWERRLTDEDFGVVRAAVGGQRLEVRIHTPETKPVEDLEPMAALALRRFVRTHSSVPDLPIGISLAAFGRIVIRAADHAHGREATLGLVRALLGQLATLHAPDDMRIAAVTAGHGIAEWDWLKWLPHAQHPGRSDALGPRRLLTDSLAELEDLLGAELAARPRHGSGDSQPAPHVVVVLDGGEVGRNCQLVGPGLAGTTVIDLSGRIPAGAGGWLLVLDVGWSRDGQPQLDIYRGDKTRYVGLPDQLTLIQATALARQLAPYRLAGKAAGEEPLARTFELTDLAGVGDPASW